MKKKILIVVVIMLIMSVYIAGCTVNVSPSGSSSSLDSKSLRQLYESGLPVPDNQPFFDKNHSCVVFHDGKKDECGANDEAKALAAANIGW